MMNSKNFKTQVFVFAMLLTFGISVSGQTPDEPTELEPNQTLTREMTGKKTHIYKFELKKDEFFQVRVQQKSVDVLLRLFDADGNILATMDSPNSKEGPETLSFVASKNGKYKLEISGFDETAEKGIYTINRIASRTATDTDKKRVETERTFVEGITARDTAGQGENAIKKLEEALKGW